MRIRIGVRVDVIEDTRAKSRLTVQDLAERAGIREETYYDLRLGRTNPRISTIGLICDVLHLNFADVVYVIHDGESTADAR